MATAKRRRVREEDGNVAHGEPVVRELGAFCRVNHVEAEPTREGPLDGLTFSIKDIFDVAGSRTGFGQPTWLESHPSATITAPAIACLLGGGARLVGRTICDELTYSLTGQNVHYGTPLNPRCPDRLPGGSSSGAASAVAGGLCDIGLGSDCAGSVRIPASYCGVYGMRPTHGRISLDGVCPFAPSFDTVGWMARDVGVLARAGNVLLAGSADAEVPQSVTTILVARDAFQLVGPAVERSLASPVARLCDAVGQSREVTVSDEGLERWAECFTTIQAFEIWRSLGDWVERAQPELGPGIRERIAHAATVSEGAAEQQRTARAFTERRLSELVRPGTALCLPTAPSAAPLRHSPSDDVEVALRARAISLLCMAGLGGLPQLTLPLGTLDGCPLGLSIVGARGTDSALLALAASLE
jgi:amidase